MLVCAFFVRNCTRDRGCSAHPAFPAPSVFWRDERRCKPRAQCAARSRNYIHVIASAAKQSIVPYKGRMDCFAALAMTWIGRGAPRWLRFRPDQLDVLVGGPLCDV